MIILQKTLLQTLVNWISNCVLFGDVKIENSNPITPECHSNLDAFVHIKMITLH
jgi:hypothetical protein